MNELLSIQHLKKNITPGESIVDINLTLYDHMILGILGHCTSEKKLLLDILSGKTPYDSGTIFINETPIADHKICGDFPIAYLQPSMLIDEMTVMENCCYVRVDNLTFFTKNKSMSKILMREIEHFNLDLCLSDTISHLCPEDRMTVLILKSYISGAKIIIIDDIGMSLAAGSKKIRSFILQLKDLGLSFILSSSLLTELTCFTDDILYITAGRAKRHYQNDLYSIKKRTLSQVRDYNSHSHFSSDNSMLHVEFKPPRREIPIQFSLHSQEYLLLLDFNGRTAPLLFRFFMQDVNSKNNCLVYQGSPLTEEILKQDFVFEDLSVDNNTIIKCLSLEDNLTLQDKEKFECFGFIQPKSLRYIRQCFLNWYPEFSVPEKSDCYKCTFMDILAIKLYRTIIRNPKVFILFNPNYSYWNASFELVQRTLSVLRMHGTSILIISNDMEFTPYINSVDRILCIDDGQLVT